MVIDGIDYPVTGIVESKTLKIKVPVLDIKMMSKERWNELAEEQKAKHGDSYKVKTLE